MLFPYYASNCVHWLGFKVLAWEFLLLHEPKILLNQLIKEHGALIRAGCTAFSSSRDTSMVVVRDLLGVCEVSKFSYICAFHYF